MPRLLDRPRNVVTARSKRSQKMCTASTKPKAEAQPLCQTGISLTIIQKTRRFPLRGNVSAHSNDSASQSVGVVNVVDRRKIRCQRMGTQQARGDHAAYSDLSSLSLSSRVALGG